ncbi:MAG: hypothetical protein S4CHLAM20_04190 [Chlamydiia bacterium]|nr:hypothetical protein [Chlamydiia bacterium]
MIDVTVYESGEGGELVLNETDLGTTNSLFNQVYIAWFGGNVADYDRDSEEFQKGEQRKGYWQNEAFFSDDNEDAKMVSRIEYMLANTALTSQGIFDLQREALDDLDFLSKTAEVSVEINLIEVDKISIIAILKEKKIQNEQRFKFIWDSTQSELIEKIII